MRLTRVRSQFLLAGTAAVALASAAFAQTEPGSTQVAGAESENPNVQVAGVQPENPNAVNRAVVETVIVTARRREEDPQRVPISLSVIPMETLERTRTYNINQL